MLEKSEIVKKENKLEDKENKKELNNGIINYFFKNIKKKYKYIKGYTKYIFENKKRIITIGDIHGDYNALLLVLIKAKIIDKNNKWIGGNTHVVQIGDILDTRDVKKLNNDEIKYLEDALNKIVRGKIEENNL